MYFYTSLFWCFYVFGWGLVMGMLFVGLLWLGIMELGDMHGWVIIYLFYCKIVIYIYQKYM
jgi:hypothetical protein